jgi:hypothetical protein
MVLMRTYCALLLGSGVPIQGGKRAGTLAPYGQAGYWKGTGCGDAGMHGVWRSWRWVHMEMN